MKVHSQIVKNPRPVETYIPAIYGLENCNKIILQNSITSLGNNYSYPTIHNNFFASYSFAPHSTIAFSVAHSSFPYNIISEFKTGFSYIYDLKLNKRYNISFAIPINYLIKKYNNNNILTTSMTDEWGNIISSPNIEINKSYQTYSIGFSSAFSTQNLRLGTNITNLQSIFYKNKETSFNTFFWGDYTLQKNNFFITNSTLININTTGLSYKNMTSIHNKKILVGFAFGQSIGIKTITTFGTELGINFGYLSILYYYQFSRHFLQSSNQSHEIAIYYKFKCGKKYKKNTIICPAYQL